MNKQEGSCPRNYWKALLVIAMVIVALVVTVTMINDWRKDQEISTAMQSEKMQEFKEKLNKLKSTSVEANGWAEERAMKRIVEEYNSKVDNKHKDMKYSIYKMVEGNYWITSEVVYTFEFCLMAGDYYTCLGDSITGINKEEKTYIFEYMNEDQEKLVNLLIEDAEDGMDSFDIEAKRDTLGEVTFVTIVVKPKTDFVKGEASIDVSFLSCNL